MKKANLLLLTLLLSACSSSSKSTPSLTFSEIPKEIDLFAARGHMTGSSFERIHIKDGIMWKECGSVPKTSSRKLKADSKLLVEGELLHHLNQSEKNILAKNFEDTKEAVSSASSGFNPPGSIHSLAKPGVFELRAKDNSGTTHILTSLDEITNAETIKAKKARRFYQTLRSIGTLPCERETFFGIASKKP